MRRDPQDRTKEIARREDERLPPCRCHDGSVDICPRHFNQRSD